MTQFRFSWTNNLQDRVKRANLDNAAHVRHKSNFLLDWRWLKCWGPRIYFWASKGFFSSTPIWRTRKIKKARTWQVIVPISRHCFVTRILSIWFTNFVILYKVLRRSSLVTKHEKLIHIKYYSPIGWKCVGVIAVSRGRPRVFTTQSSYSRFSKSSKSQPWSNPCYYYNYRLTLLIIPELVTSQVLVKLVRRDTAIQMCIGKPCVWPFHLTNLLINKSFLDK